MSWAAVTAALILKEFVFHHDGFKAAMNIVALAGMYFAIDMIHEGIIITEKRSVARIQADVSGRAVRKSISPSGLQSFMDVALGQYFAHGGGSFNRWFDDTRFHFQQLMTGLLGDRFDALHVDLFMPGQQGDFGPPVVECVLNSGKR